MQTTAPNKTAQRKARTRTPAIEAPKPKKDQLVDLLRAKGGADIKALSDTLGWQPHTVRAALTRLRQAGVTVEKMPARDGELSRYRINVKRGRSAQ